MQQEPPFAIQIEPVEGCSLACSFCGIQSIRHNGANAVQGIHGKNSAPYRFMDIKTATLIARQVRHLGWNPRIEFAMHGEPTMHPDLWELVQVFRKCLPRAYIMVTSNGSGLMKIDRLTALINSGINTLALDDYVHANFVPKVRKLLEQLPHVPVYDYPKQPQGNPHKRHNGLMVTVIADISQNTTGTHQLTNQGGNSFESKREPLKERCAKPFRELSIRWNGAVALCCDDWRGEYKIGTVFEHSLLDLWNHPRFDAARRRLYHADRNFGPCTGCDVRTYRNGLLPDKFGKTTLPFADVESQKHLRAALRGKVFTMKVAP